MSEPSQHVPDQDPIPQSGPAARSRRWVVVTWVVIAAVVAGFLVVHLLTGGMGRR